MKLCDPHRLAMLCALALIAAPAAAQEQAPQQAGQVAESAVGEVGQRQTRDQAPANIEPMGRINNRIANRVQNRIRNRIDRYYDPRANATSPFEVAADQVQTVTPRR